ncbi:ATP-binding protein [Desulfococcus sp.]|uniref:sensor histidine kinase n=1 Tax=Desulfococcus sp. TaxID=2025834 RepID=UPI0035936240
MFRTINQKFYGILGLLAILFSIGYAEMAYFLHKQSRVAAQGQRIVRVEREIGTLLNLFFEMRFWERAVFTQEFSDAEQRFGTLMAQLKRHLAGLSDEPADAAITGRLGPASELLRRYEQDFNRLMQINTEHRLQRTRIDSSYQSLASSILSIRNPVFLKSLFVLTQFQMSYADNPRASDYRALQVVIESLKAKLKQADALNERLSGYLDGYGAILDEDIGLVGEFASTSMRFNETSEALTALLSHISGEAEKSLQTEFARAETLRERLSVSFLASMAASLLTMLLVITLLARNILRPVRSVARVIADIKSGSMASRFDFPGDPKDDIVMLGVTLNDMLDTLDHKNRQLLGYQEALEAKVRELALREGEREALIEALEVKNAELERFTYTVSHDLKSPLITIQGFLGFLEKDALGGDMARVKEDCSRIRGAAHRMQELLNDLLELSRIGRLINPPERIPFEEIAREAKEMVSGRMAEKNIRVEIAGNLPIVCADRQRLREALENLLDNAGKYMGTQPAPRIEIGCRQTDDGPVFFVRDNGMGIDPPYHSKVFGLFEKLDPSAEGAGVGLAIVKRIVEVHGGRVWVESKGAGHGSSFCFTLQGDMDSNIREPL